MKHNQFMYRADSQVGWNCPQHWLFIILVILFGETVSSFLQDPNSEKKTAFKWIISQRSEVRTRAEQGNERTEMQFELLDSFFTALLESQGFHRQNLDALQLTSCEYGQRKLTFTLTPFVCYSFAY